MNKITVVNNKKRVDIIIDKVKYVVGNDESIKYLLENTFYQYFNKVSNSDYAKENDMNSYILFDEELLNIKDFDFFYVNKSFDLDLDIKLGTKSMCLQYVNSLLNNLEFNETFQTICILLEDLFENIIDEVESSDIRPLFNIKFTIKDLIKLISFEFIKDNDSINNYDLSLEEKLCLQFYMIKKINEESNKKSIIYVNVPCLTKRIYDLIMEIGGYKIVTFEYTNIKDINDILIVNNNLLIDIQDDNSIFNLCNNYNSHITISEMKNMLINDHLIKKYI